MSEDVEGLWACKFVCLVGLWNLLLCSCCLSRNLRCTFGRCEYVFHAMLVIHHVVCRSLVDVDF
jgi:hypothetical protein